jgi:hypothetical protein
MKTIIRRLQQLEDKVVRHEIGGPSCVDILRERQRRRAEADGVPYVEPVRDPIPHVNGRCPTWAEVLRYRRSQRTAETESRRAEEAAQCG